MVHGYNEPLAFAYESVQVNISALWEMKVIKEVPLPKRHKAAGPNGLSPPFFKDGSKVLISALAKLLKSIWIKSGVNQCDPFCK